MVYDGRIAIQRPGILFSTQGLGQKFFYNITALASEAVGTANLAVFAKIWNPRPFTATHGWCFNGTTASGNVDVGVYKPNGDDDLIRIGSTGTTAQSGTSQVQMIAFATPFIVPAGEIVLACGLSSATATLMRGTLGTWNLYYRQLSAFGQLGSSFPLPATATTVVQMTTFSGGPPYFGVCNRLY